MRLKGIKICHLNIYRLMDHLSQLRIFTETHRPYVLCLNETKLNDNTCDEDLFVMGFHPILEKKTEINMAQALPFMGLRTSSLKNETICLLTLSLFQLSLSSHMSRQL